MTTHSSLYKHIFRATTIITGLVLVELMIACSTQLGEYGNMVSPTLDPTPVVSSVTLTSPTDRVAPPTCPEPSVPTHTKTVTPGVATDTCLVGQLCQITTRPVSWFQWSPNGETLVYQIADDESYWEFNDSATEM